MTSYGVPEDAELADGISAAIRYAGANHEVWAALSELRSAATPGNGFRVASVPWGGPRRLAAGALRRVAEDGHPAAAKLLAAADGLDAAQSDYEANQPQLPRSHSAARVAAAAPELPPEAVAEAALASAPTMAAVLTPAPAPVKGS